MKKNKNALAMVKKFHVDLYKQFAKETEFLKSFIIRKMYSMRKNAPVEYWVVLKDD